MRYLSLSLPLFPFFLVTTICMLTRSRRPLFLARYLVSRNIKKKGKRKEKEGKGKRDAHAKAEGARDRGSGQAGRGQGIGEGGQDF